MDCAARCRRRLVSATYEGGGRASKQLLEDCALAVYDERAETADVARFVADTQLRVRADNGAFFVMDAAAVDARLAQWRSTLPAVRPFYDVRCNADPLLLRLLTRGGCALRVSTLAQLELALAVVPATRISFDSPLLTRKVLRVLAALPDALHSIVLDNADQAETLAALAPQQPLVLRVSLSPDAERIDLAVGMTAEEALECVPRLLLDGAALLGVSLQLQAGDMESDFVRAEEALSFIQALASLHCKLPLLDVGGGFTTATLERSAALVEAVVEASGMSRVEITASPGRFFAASAFSLVTSVIGKQRVDGSAIENDAPIGSLGVVYATNESCYGALGGSWMPGATAPVCAPLKDFGECDDYASAVVGNAWDTMDVPQRNARLPSMDIGDRLLWREAGAYGAGDEDDGVPVFYYTERAHWERLMRCDDDDSRLLSDGGSDVESEEDDDDMTVCFGRVFSH